MPVTPIRSRSGEIPPDCVSGFCAVCKREIIAPETDPRCEDCNTPLHPASLPARLVRQQAQNATQAGQPDDKPVSVAVETVRAAAAQNRSAEGQSKPLTLRPTQAARTYARSVAALVEAAEREEREAEAVYRQASAAREQAKSRYEAARQEAHKLRQLRDLIVVDDAPAPASDGKRWSRNYDACRICGTTSVRHNSKGRCVTCQNYWQRNGRERPVNKETPDGN